MVKPSALVSLSRVEFHMQMGFFQYDLELVAEGELDASAQEVMLACWDVSSSEVDCETFVVVRVVAVFAVGDGGDYAFCVIKFCVDGSDDGSGKDHLGSDAEHCYTGFKGEVHLTNSCCLGCILRRGRFGCPCPCSVCRGRCESG